MRHLIIDTDVGIDDAASIAVAFETPSVQVKALTVVEGNVDIPEAVAAAQRLANIYQKEVEIYAGKSGPLLKKLYNGLRWEGHGTDGFGDFTTTPEYKDFQKRYCTEKETATVSSEVAAVALVRMVNEQPNKYDLMALGPLTNIALALQLDPKFLHKIKSLYIMGACILGKGNVSDTAEFNIHYDPEAAFIVFDAGLEHTAQTKPAEPIIKLVPWEVTVDNAFEWNLVDRIFETETKTSMLLKGIITKFRNSLPPAPVLLHYTAFDLHQANVSKLVLPDLHCMMAYLYPELVTSFKDWDVKVELHGINSRGSTSINWMNPLFINARVIKGLDRSMLNRNFEKTINGNK